MLLCRALLTISLALVLPSCAFAGGGYPDLRDSHDAELQSQVDERLGAFPQFWDGVRKKELSVVVADVTDLHHPEVAWYNPDQMLYAASLPKVGIIFAAVVEVQEGNLELTDELRENLVKAVTVSSNASASWVLDKVGIERVAEILQDPAHGALYDPEHGGGVWVGKPYDKRPAWKRDPMHGISHGASAMAVARFYYGLLNGTLVKPEYQPLMAEIFGNPHLHHKFVKGLQGRDDVRIYRKSGTWRHYHADSGIFDRDDSRYIVVAIDVVDGADDGMVRGIPMIDDLMQERHGGKAQVEAD